VLGLRSQFIAATSFQARTELNRRLSVAILNMNIGTGFNQCLHNLAVLSGDCYVQRRRATNCPHIKQGAMSKNFQIGVDGRTSAAIMPRSLRERCPSADPQDDTENGQRAGLQSRLACILDGLPLANASHPLRRPVSRESPSGFALENAVRGSLFNKSVR